MSADDPMASEGFKDIPDPARYVAEQPAPEAALPQEPSPTRADRRRRTILLTAVAVAWILLVVANLGLRADLLAVEVAVPLVLWIAFAAIGLKVSLRPRDRGLPPGLRAVQIIAIAAPLLFAAGTLLGSRGEDAAAFTWESSRGCLIWASITAAGPMLLAGLLLQRSFLSAPAWRGAAIGAVCGLCAAAGIHSHCMLSTPAHVLLAHGFPIVSGALLGAVFGALRGRA